MVFFSHIKLSNPSNTKLKSVSKEKKLCPENILVIVCASGKIVLLKLQAIHIYRRTSRRTDGRTDGQSIIQCMYTSNQPPRDISFYFSLYFRRYMYMAISHKRALYATLQHLREACITRSLVRDWLHGWNIADTA